MFGERCRECGSFGGVFGGWLVCLSLDLEMGLTCRGTCLDHLDRVGRRLGILLGHSHPQLVPIAPHDVSSPTNKYIVIKTQKKRKEFIDLGRTTFLICLETSSIPKSSLDIATEISSLAGSSPVVFRGGSFTPVGGCVWDRVWGG